MESDIRTQIAEWIEARAREKDAPALTWLLQRSVHGLLRCYPSASDEENARMILEHVKILLAREE